MICIFNIFYKKLFFNFKKQHHKQLIYKLKNIYNIIYINFKNRENLLYYLQFGNIKY